MKVGPSFFLGNIGVFGPRVTASKPFLSPAFNNAFKRITVQSSSLVTKIPKINFRNYATFNQLRMSGSSWSRGSNSANLKTAALFSLVFCVGTTFATPYLMKYTPLAFFNKNPSLLVYSLIGINAAVFALWKAPQYWRVLSRYGLLEKDARFNKWSMIGSAFSHQDFWHIGMNMLALYSFGTTVASYVGASNFLIMYLNGAVLSSFASLAYPVLAGVSSMGASLGASGALFAILGSFSYLFPYAKILLFVFPVPGGAWIAFLASIGWNLCGCVFRWGSFDYAAHLGGSIVGIFYGWLIDQRRKEFKRNNRTVW
ncbi:BA75_04603T0 [Komagataella pastoris]|uniref:BA75_04603T0 n=1 Tax=Komagataella pastoris TaxID=4922 RepID=A0A1B2JHM2_PICPA|nr:BA75_04603T0 [Komagataella pastoris]